MDLSQLTDEQLLALHKASGPDLSKLSDEQLLALHGSSKQPPERSILDDLKRQGGLTVRHGVEGIMALPSMVMDPLNKLVGLKPLSEGVSNLLTSAGVPKPETDMENVVGAVSKGIAGASPLTAAALAARGTTAALPVVRSMAGAPIRDIASSGVGAGASELTKQAGGGDIAQAVAGMIAPSGLGATANVAQRGAHAVNELRRPLTKGGAEQIAADTLGRIVQDKTAALSNLGQYNSLKASGATVGVPGSKPTAAAVAGDYGLIGGQQVASRGDAAPNFATRGAENNQARLDDLAKLNATDKYIDFYKQKRDAATAPLREQAFSKQQMPVDYGRVEGLITALQNSPAGGKQEPSRALAKLQQWVAERKAQGRVGAEDAYGLHQDINDLIRGRVNDEQGAIRLSAGMATSIKKELADVIEEVAPGFNKYLEKYSRLSKPIDRLETIKDKLGGVDLTKVTNAMPQATPNGAAYTLSQAKMRNAVQGINDETRLAPRQQDVLSRVLGDLNGETLASRGGKQPGSDTYQNMAAANFVNRVLGGTIAESGLGKAVQGPLNLLGRPFESRINDMIQKAYQDPKEMERLLRKARTQRGSPTLAGLLDYTGTRAGGGLLGSLLQ